MPQDDRLPPSPVSLSAVLRDWRSHGCLMKVPVRYIVISCNLRALLGNTWNSLPFLFYYLIHRRERDISPGIDFLDWMSLWEEEEVEEVMRSFPADDYDNPASSCSSSSSLSTVDGSSIDRNNWFVKPLLRLWNNWKTKRDLTWRSYLPIFIDRRLVSFFIGASFPSSRWLLNYLSYTFANC